MNAAPPLNSAYRLRLIVGFTLVIGLLAGAWAWSLYSPLDAAVRSQQQQRLTDLARAAAVVVSQSDAPAQEVLKALASDNDVRFTLVAMDGTVLADTQENPSLLENHGDRPEIRAALNGEAGSDVRRSESQGVDRMYVAVPATGSGGERVAVRTSESLDRIAALARQARGAGVLLLPIVLAIAAVAAWRVTRAAAEPVERLATAARAMAAGDLASGVPVERGAMLPLSSALSTLREELRSRLSALESEQLTLRTALDGLSDGVLLLDRELVRLANRAFSSMFRTPPGDLVGRSLAELGLPAPIESAVRTRLDAASPAVVDLGPDPFQRYHRVLVIPLGDAEGDRRALVVVADISEVMRLDAVRRDFVANASHELKTPTASILLLAESADQAAADGDEEQAIAFLSQIRAEATRLRQLVSDLLDLSRIEGVPTAGEIADVRHTIELGLAGHRRAAALKGLSLVADLQDVAGIDVAVRCSQTDLAVALDNLLSNAINYTESGGVTVHVAADDATVTVDVRDTGIGIPESDVERVFERFYRVDRARSRTSGGTGLGLALVRNIAERAGGSADISSRPGEGTTVSLRLPRAR